MRDGRLLLFDTLLRLPEYSNAGLKEALRGSSILSNLSVEKVRLTKIILGCVSTLRDNRKSPNDPLIKLNEARAFFQLGLFEEAGEAANKGLELAMEIEVLHAEVQLRDLLRVIYKELKNEDFTAISTQNEYLLETASKKLARSIRYQIINDRAFNYLRRYRVTDEEGVKKGMEELVNLPEMRDIKMADSLQSQIRFYETWNYYHSSKNELDSAIKALFKSIELWESKPKRIEMLPFEYMSTVSNLLGKLSIANRLHESPFLLKKLEDVSVFSIDGEARKWPDVELQYQLYFMNSGKLEMALEREKQTLEVLRKYGKRMRVSVNLTLLYNLAVAHLLCGNARKSLVYCTQIRDFGVVSDRQDLQGVARLLRLLLLAENDTAGTFFHYFRNSKRFFKSSHRAYRMEQVVLNWLQEHYRLEDSRQREKSFRHLSVLLNRYVKQGMAGAEEMQIWAFANAKQLPLMLVFKQNLHKAV